MSRRPAQTASEIAAGASAATGRQLSFVRTLDGGETGASQFRDQDGGVFVIKSVCEADAVERRTEAVVASERLRAEAGWPTPRRNAVFNDGWLYVLQEFVIGQTIKTMTHLHLDDLFDCHDRRLGLGRESNGSGFATHLIETLVVGGDHYCQHEPLRGLSDRTRGYIERVEAIGRHLTEDDFPANDLIHWDLHPGNLIEDNGQLVGIIDLDHAKVGDGLVDLTMLALSARIPGHDPSVTARATEAGVTSLTDAQRAGYIAHLTLRFLDWAVRKGRTNEVTFWLDQCDDLLP